MQGNFTSGGTSIDDILASTELIVQPGQFYLAGISPELRTQLESDLSSIKGGFFQYINEVDVLTLLIRDNEWAEISNHYPEAMVEGPLHIFTFSVAMDWQVVGFLAAVTGLLARAGIPLGAVCGYYRDHLFIDQMYAEQAETLLRAEIKRCKQRN